MIDIQNKIDNRVPQITFFRPMNIQHSKYSIESRMATYSGTFEFNKTIYCDFIDDNLINNMFIEIVLPKIEIQKNVQETVETNLAYSIYNEFYQDMINYMVFLDYNILAYNNAINQYNLLNGSASDQVIYQQMLNQITSIFNDLQNVNSELTIAYNNTLLIIQKINLNYMNFLNNKIYNIENISLNSLVINSPQVVSDLNYFTNQMTVYVNESTKLYQMIEYIYNYYLNQYTQLMTPRYKFAWADNLAFALIDSIELTKGAESIDQQFGNWMMISNQLMTNYEMIDNMNKMIGNIPQLTTFDTSIKPSYVIYIPLQFWFNRSYGSSLPVMALTNAKLTLSINVSDANLCCYIEGFDGIDPSENISLENIFSIQGYILNTTIYWDTIYLLDRERKKITQNPDIIIAEKLETLVITNIIKQQSSILLSFISPVKELFWIIQNTSQLSNISGKNKPLNLVFIGSNDFTMLTSVIKFDQDNRTIIADDLYYNKLLISNLYNNTIYEGIYYYSFSLMPYLTMPTGHCNIVNINNPTLNIIYDPSVINVNDPIVVTIFSKSYQKLTIRNGTMQVNDN